MKIAKKLMTKAEKDHGDLQLAILDWRNTPTDSSNKSPAQKLHSRRTRTLLPTAESLLLPEVPSNIQEVIELKRQKAKFYYDRLHSDLHSQNATLRQGRHLEKSKSSQQAGKSVIPVTDR